MNQIDTKHLRWHQRLVELEEPIPAGNKNKKQHPNKILQLNPMMEDNDISSQSPFDNNSMKRRRRFGGGISNRMGDTDAITVSSTESSEQHSDTIW